MNDDPHQALPSEGEGEGGLEAAAKDFPIVGVGTSAGGVQALQVFFEGLPDVDAAFVVVVISTLSIKVSCRAFSRAARACRSLRFLAACAWNRAMSTSFLRTVSSW